MGRALCRCLVTKIRQKPISCLEAWGNDPGFILTVGCDFPKEVPFENVKALMSLKSEAASG